MTIGFWCTKCRQQIRVPDGTEGRKTKCPHCQEIQRIPGESEATKPAAEDEYSLKEDTTPSAQSESLFPTSSGGSLFDDLEPAKPSGGAPPPNPFGDAPTAPAPSNPYASPAGVASAFANKPSRVSREDARNKLMGPTIVVLILAGLCALSSGFAFILQLANVNEIMADADIPDGPERIGFYIGFFGVYSVPALLSLFTCFAMARTLQVRNYAISMIGFIASMVPCTTSICCVLAIPFAIWGIVVLSDDKVKQAFSLR